MKGVVLKTHLKMGGMEDITGGLAQEKTAIGWTIPTAVHPECAEKGRN